MKEGLKEKLAAGALAFGGACGIGTELSIVCQNNLAYAELLLLLCIYFFYLAYLRCFTYRKTRGFYLLTGGLSIIFSMMLFVGGMLDGYSYSGFSADSFFKFLSLVTAIYPMISSITIWLNQRERNTQHIQNSKWLLPVCFGVVALIWFLTYLALFPGVYGTDVTYWYYEFSRPDVPISSQWSPLYCGIYYSFMRLGEILFDSHEYGFAMFSFVQMSFVLFAVWNILLFFNRHFQGIAVVCAAAFFALLPTHVILSLTSAQDPVFAACCNVCAAVIRTGTESANVLDEKEN